MLNSQLKALPILSTQPFCLTLGSCCHIMSEAFNCPLITAFSLSFWLHCISETQCESSVCVCVCGLVWKSASSVSPNLDRVHCLGLSWPEFSMAADTLAVPFPVHCRHWPTCAAQTWTCRLLPDRTEQCSPFTSCRFGLRCMYYTTCCLLISALKFTYSLNSLNGSDALFNLRVETACRRSRYEIASKGSLRRGFWNTVYSGCTFPKGRSLL